MSPYFALAISAAAVVINLALWWTYARDRSAQRQYAREQAANANGGGPKPLPVHLVEASQRFKIAHDCWPLLIGQAHDGTVWVVVRRAQLPSPPPADFLEHGTDSTLEGQP